MSMARFEATKKVDMSFPGRNVMFSNSFMSLRRSSGFALAFLFFATCLCAGAWAQTAPAAVASFATGLAHDPSFGKIANTATDTLGDWLVVDEGNGALYELPAGSASFKALVAAGGLAGSGSGSSVPLGIAIDPMNNLYIEGGTCILMYPYDAPSGSWPGLAALTPKNTSSAACATSAMFYDFGTGVLTWGVGIGNTSTPSLLVGTSQKGSSSANGIASIAVSGTWSTPAAGTVTQIITGLHGTVTSVASDSKGNIYFVEQGQGSLPGVLEIPAGQTGLTSDSSLTRIDPNLPTVTGATLDGAGNIYIGDKAAGVFLLPASSTATPGSAIMLTSAAAQGTVGVTGNNGFLLVPTTDTEWNGVSDVAQVALNAASFGPQAVGASKPAQGNVVFSFNASATPGTIEVLEAGSSNPDFAIVNGGSDSCVANPHSPNGAQTSCTVSVSFTPHAAGAVSASLTMLDNNGNLLASLPLSGIGISAAVQLSPAAESAIDGGLATPGQITVDASGNLYVADAGLGGVMMFPRGLAAGAAGTPVGKSLTAPTGVTVDGAGDVFIADSGNIYEVPETASGLNSKGQVTLKTGLGANVWLAADSLGNLFVSDADNQKVYELENFGAGFNTELPGVLASQVVTLTGAAVSAPGAIAVDSSDNLYVVNGGSVYEVTPAGAQSAVLTGLAGITGLAIDPSGSVFAAMAGGTIRVPNEGGTLKLADKTAVASSVTSPASVALDSLGNIYVADGVALNVDMTSSSASIDFGTLNADPLATPPSADSFAAKSATLLNYGNAPLVVTGYANTSDYIESADTCIGNSIDINSTCSMTVTFSAGIGDGGNLTGAVLVQGNLANSPVGVNGTGVAPTLAGTQTAMTVASNGSIQGVPVAVTVAPNPANAAQLTGTVTLTVVPGSNVPVTDPPLPNPYTITLPLAADGTAQFVPTGLTFGTYTFSARYNGDPTYIYEHSIISAPVTVATSVPVAMTPLAVSSSASIPLESYSLPCTSGSASSCTTSYSYGDPTGKAVGYLILGGNCDGCGGQEPTDGSTNQWVYSYNLSVAPTAGGSLAGLAVYNTSTTPPVFTGFNYGTVNFEIAGGHSLCGDDANSTSISPLDDTGVLQTAFSIGCAKIDTSNTTIPAIMTYYSVTPVYSGTYNNLVDKNPNYNSVTGSPVGIWAVRSPMIKITSDPPALSVAPGATVKATLTLTSILGYGYAGRNNTYLNWSQPVSLQCQGLPPYATCSFTYPTPNPADPNFASNPGALECASSSAASPTYCAIDIGPEPGAVTRYARYGNPLPANPTADNAPCGPIDGCLGAGQVLLTINTNVSPGIIIASNDSGKSTLAIASLLGLGLFGLAFRRRSARLGNLLLVVGLLLSGSVLVGISACSTKTLGAAAVSGVTPPGSYWVTVTANETGSLPVQTPPPPVDPNKSSFPLLAANGSVVSLPYTINVTVSK